MRFRPCIDLHDGKVKQIIGSTLQDNNRGLETNFESTLPPNYFADLYYRDGLQGGHVIKLGPGNDQAAREALAAHPGNLQIGGGITPLNAREWLDAGAQKVIVTSYVFHNGQLDPERLQQLAEVVAPEQLVLDLSCKFQDGAYHVACNRWQTVTDTILEPQTFRILAQFCSEFLVHAVDVEGRQQGIDTTLATLLADLCPLPVTYAGGAHSMADIDSLNRAGRGKVDVTVGSALDIFGGNRIRYQDMVAMDRQNRNQTTMRPLCHD